MPRQDGRPRIPSTQAAGLPPHRGCCQVPAPDGAVASGRGAAGLQVWPPLSVATAVQGTYSRCEFRGPDPCPRVRLWWARVSVVTRPPGADRSSRAACPPSGEAKGCWTRDRPACGCQCPAQGHQVALLSLPFSGFVQLPRLATCCPGGRTPAENRSQAMPRIRGERLLPGLQPGRGGTVPAAQSAALSGLSQQVPPARHPLPRGLPGAGLPRRGRG